MPPRMGGVSRPKHLKSTLRRTAAYLSPYRWELALVTVAVILNSLGNVYSTWLLKPLVNDGLMPFINQSPPRMERLQAIVVQMLIAAGVCTLGVLLFRTLMVKVSTSVLAKIRTDTFDHLETLSISYFDKRTHGESMSLFTNDVNAMREMLSNSLPETINSGLRVVAVFTIMVCLSWQLSLVSAAMMSLMYVIIRFLGRRSSAFFKLRQDCLGNINGYIEEMMEGQNVVKAFCYEQSAITRFAELNERMRHSDVGANTYASILFPITGNLSHLLFAVTAALGGFLSINGHLDVGTVAAFLYCTRGFSMPINQLSQQFNAVLNALAGAERIFAVIDEPSEDDQGSTKLVHIRQYSQASGVKACSSWAWQIRDEAGKEQLHPLHGVVEFSNVTFAYDGVNPVLRNISLVANRGQKVAFVGATGAGKTTITNLLNRFYDIDSGLITYDGIPLNTLRKADLRRSLAMVLQDTHLFSGTVQDSIRYGRPGASLEQVIEAAKIANAHYFISHLPQGYETSLCDNGSNLSQGQRQLLSIARAAIMDPPVLVLDEATSSVDTKTEALIERGFDRLMQGRTVFVIAHRLSTVRNSDLIVVLDHGSIIEQGNHEQLLALKGQYYKLYTGQIELE